MPAIPIPKIKDKPVWDDVASFVCHYGSFEETIGLFDVAILESKNITLRELAWLREHGTYTVGYISVGEDHNKRELDRLGPGGYASFYIDDGTNQPTQNKNWKSYFVDAGSDLWQQQILERARSILRQGFDGFFLDTIDTAEIYPETRAGMAQLIRRLRETFPDSKIIVNRGFFMIEDFAPYISGIMFEDLTGGYDFEQKVYTVHQGDDLEWTGGQAGEINRIRQTYYFPVFALDYANPDDIETIQALYDRAWEFDFIPSVSVIKLNQVFWRDIAPQTVRGTRSGRTFMTYKESPHAFSNPMMGFRANAYHKHKTMKNYETTAHVYIAWDDLERSSEDGVERIKDVSEELWGNLTGTSRKVIPRVFLDHPHYKPGPGLIHMPAYGTDYYLERRWPKDMAAGDYNSPEFLTRLDKFVKKLGQAWDKDPRVAFVEIGIIGYWGEHHQPRISMEHERVLGEAFTKAFPNKKIMKRYPSDFEDYDFGVYWDSFGHLDEMYIMEGILEMGSVWKTQPIGGEAAYNWGNYKIQPGESPDVTLGTPIHREFFINMTRRVHASNLGWVADYKSDDPEVLNGADLVQKALGYRFVINSAEFTDTVSDLEKGYINVRMFVQNVGSAPFYYNWPIELSLMRDGEIFAGYLVDDFDISKVMPGQVWNEEEQKYDIPAPVYEIKAAVPISSLGAASGDYMLCAAIPDPSGGLPVLRFANENHTKNDRTPLGWIGIGIPSVNKGLDGFGL